jgi:hypothetical protein
MLARMAEERNQRQIGAGQSIGRGLAMGGQGVQQGLMQRNRLDEAKARRIQAAAQADLNRWHDINENRRNREAAMERAKLPFQFNINSGPATLFGNEAGGGATTPQPTETGKIGPMQASPDDLFGLRALAGGGSREAPQDVKSGASPIRSPGDASPEKVERVVAAAESIPSIRGFTVNPKTGKWRPPAGATNPRESFFQLLTIGALNTPEVEPEQVVEKAYQRIAASPSMKPILKKIEESGDTSVRPTDLIRLPDGRIKDLRSNRIFGTGIGPLEPTQEMADSGGAYPNAAIAAGRLALRQGKGIDVENRLIEKWSKEYGGELFVEPEGKMLIHARMAEPLSPMSFVPWAERTAAIEFVKRQRARLRQYEEQQATRRGP